MQASTAHEERPESPGIVSYETFPFFNHSTSTAHHHLKPDSVAEEGPSSRQKRKRTSPEDQTILEQAYKLDTKPDRAARLQLVERVNLSEKEVQIWYQNRRQSSRRRSRPLLPHEVAQYQLARSVHPFDEMASESAAVAATSTTLYAMGFEPRSADLAYGARASLIRSASSSAAEPTAVQPLPGVSTMTPRATTPISREEAQSHSPDRTSFAPSSLTIAPPPAPSHTSVGYLANRRSAPTLHQSFPSPSKQSPSQAMRSESSNGGLKKSSSLVRLAMSADGNAVVSNGASPSPPKSSQVRLSSTRLVASLDLDGSKSLQRSSSGRSRDSRSWEFWCDKESRSELEVAAEKDASGSAAGAIGLVRAASRAKRIPTLHRRTTGAKRQRVGPKAQLSRSSTAQGRLQGQKPATERSLLAAAPKLKHTGSAAVRISGDGSDKENWSPEGGSEAFDPETDSEVTSFMRGSGKKASSEDDLDCVQGLLSLSQGAWR